MKGYDDIYRHSIGTLGHSSSNSIFRLDDFDIDKVHFDNCILVPKVIDGEKYMMMIRGKKAYEIIKTL